MSGDPDGGVPPVVSMVESRGQFGRSVSESVGEVRWQMQRDLDQGIFSRQHHAELLGQIEAWLEDAIDSPERRNLVNLRAAQYQQFLTDKLENVDVFGAASLDGPWHEWRADHPDGI